VQAHGPGGLYDAENHHVNVGHLHANPNCTYLIKRPNPHSEIIPMSGPILDLLPWCSKCAPKPRESVNYEFSADIPARTESQRQIDARFLLPAASGQERK